MAQVPRDSEWTGLTVENSQMEAIGYVIADLGPEKFNQQLWWAVGTLANMEFTSQG